MAFSDRYAMLWALALMVLLLPRSEGATLKKGRAESVVQARSLDITSNWTYVGCYTDVVGARTLEINPETPGGEANLTIEVCTSTCEGLGYLIAGTEYGGECYCGNSTANSGSQSTNGGCTVPCNGNSSETCGGAYRLSVYNLNHFIETGWIDLGCYTDSVGGRTLFDMLYTIPGDNMTVENCESACFELDYTYSGVEYSDECYCANNITNGGAPASSGCDMTCNGNTTEICGGSNHINLYSYKPSSTSSSSSSSSTVVSTSSSSSSTVSTTASSSIVSSTASLSSSAVHSSTSSSSTVSSTSSSAVPSTASSSSSIFSSSTTSSSTISPSPTVSSSRSSIISSSSSSSSSLSSSSIVSSSSSSNIVSSSTSSSSPSLSSAPTVGWSPLGCFTDAVGSRTLNTQLFTIPGSEMTVEACESACLSGGWTLAGVEYSDECYCANIITNGAALATDGGCTMTCNGDTTEDCGGSNRINLYTYISASASSSTTSSTIVSSSTSKSSSLIGSTTSSRSSSTIVSSGSSSIATISSSSISSSDPVLSIASSTSASSTAVATGWTSLGCYTDGVGTRTLENQLFTIPGADMTVEACEAACLSGGWTFAGVEYSDECYCANAITNGGAPATDGCTMPCNGDATELCGGSNRINLYSYIKGTSSVTPSGSGSGSATATSSAVSTTSTTVTTTGLPTGWKYEGCWLDQAFGRILSTSTADNDAETVESCIATCIGLGYSIAGMEYFTQCYCGDAMINQATTAAETDCNTACGGNSAEICGGGNRMSIYSNQATLVVTPIPHVQVADLPGSWNYSGCLIDNAVARTFPYQIEFQDNNTATNCLSQCQAYGYGAGGMEYGEQCFCGDAQDVINADTTFDVESGCAMACTGNNSYLCGGPDRIQYYTWIGEPLQLWDFPTGPDAGLYEFLIGAPIIPLISQPGVNGKITFLEKFGTEPANNSTGAYELDMTLLSNYTAAWRPMHVKSDVFCAAGLTLPDKAGRILNVGGWANDATYGVRLYWPDGEPGTWGVNDWHENVKEVSLLNGRWYPTAMTMVNGSILVMGGEVGSNGAAVPTLEVLPLPPGGYSLFCDYLNRTDPYNLYPYLAVLPSGGIFVAYYNEARILDEVSLETMTVLPNIPGAVNDFLGGRTYPFEGTAVLMPQYAPYTDPLEVMICGGSIPGPEIALDNCVSLQPEVAGANWTIERMPSKRVISCMTALPDGTYLILNGGQQGRAGFGLATQPNLNAVLYDPTKPVTRRMSVMANTTIARLYHSEAVLLQDGRVLVTGSDPEDLRFPQEYRVEIFLPPYMLRGATPPTFTASKTDLGYGESFTITVDLPTGNLATMKISLMASVSSTHGNSMGQRTIFPEYSCAGTTCTVTTPPNGYISPPGWHMLFVLDNGMPSTAVWVRIGGDPASLGDWPAFDDFAPLPGV